jgi:serine/threonine protein kinase
MSLDNTETLKFGRYTYQSDVWAFGVLLWEIYSLGIVPYPGMNNVEAAEKVLEGYRLAKPASCPDAMYEIMMRCWKENPKERPTMEKIVVDVQAVYNNL